jgi:hypothetical protein
MKTQCRLLSVILVGWAVSVLGAGTYDLAFKFKRGDVTKYRNTVNVNILSATLPGGKMVVTEVYFETNKVLSVYADGGAQVESLISSFVQKANGEKTQATRSMQTGIPQDIPIIHEVSKDGRILNSRLGKPLTLADQIKTEAALRNMKNRGVKLPEKTLQMGESWTSEDIMSNKIPGLGILDTKLTMHHTLSSEETVLGFPCVKILLEGSATGTLAEGKGGSELKLKGALWFAPDKGDLIKMRTEHTEKLKFAGPEGPIQMETAAVVSTELLP